MHLLKVLKPYNMGVSVPRHNDPKEFLTSSKESKGEGDDTQV